MNKEIFEHYYGDAVRTLFIVGGVIMVVSYPFFRSLIDMPLPVAIFGSIALAVFGGLMNQELKWVTFLNMLISIVAFVSFQYYAVQAYLGLTPAQDIQVAFFWVNQILSIIFFFAAYLSTKTFRGALLSKKD